MTMETDLTKFLSIELGLANIGSDATQARKRMAHLRSTKLQQPKVFGFQNQEMAHHPDGAFLHGD